MHGYAALEASTVHDHVNGMENSGAISFYDYRNCFFDLRCVVTFAQNLVWHGCANCAR